MARVEITPTAEHSLDEIYDYIGQERKSPVAAANVLRRISNKCETYATQPLGGEARPDLGEGVRCFPVDSFVVIYRPIDGGIVVLLVIHGARDIPIVYRELFR